MFFYCRSVLTRASAASYVEQYQGMYTLMVGLAGAGAIGAGFNAGCALAASGAVPTFCSFIGAVAIALALAGVLIFSKPNQDDSLWVVTAAAAVAGFVSTMSPKDTIGMSLPFGLTLFSIYATRLAQHRYRYYQKYFALGVYREFAALEIQNPKLPLTGHLE